MIDRMEAFKKDEDQATINPMFIARSTRAVVDHGSKMDFSPSQEKETSQQKRSRIIHHITRTLLFLAIPLLCIWYIEDAYVQDHMLLLTYIQILFMVVFQGVFLQSFLTQENTTVKMMVVATLLYVLTCLICRATPEGMGMGKTVETESCGQCAECWWVDKEDIPGEISHYLIENEETGFFATGTSYEGTRLTREQVLTFTGHLTFAQKLLAGTAQDVDPTACDGIFVNIVATSLVGTCNGTCQAAKISRTKCKNSIRGQNCLTFLDSIKDFPFMAAFAPYIRFQFSNDETVDNLARALLIKRIQQFEHALGNVTNWLDLCGNNELFAASNDTVFNCSHPNNNRPQSSKILHKSYVATGAKVTWTTICSAIWAIIWGSHTLTFRTTKLRPLYKTDVMQLIVSIGFLVALTGFMFQKLVLFDTRSTQTIGEVVVTHTYGIVLAINSFILFKSTFALQGKKPRLVNTSENNKLLKWYSIFDALTDVDDGKYYFVYIVLFELVEIIVQMATFDVMARTNDMDYVLASTTILSLNLVTTPMAFMLSRFNDSWGRKTTFIVDTILEASYLFLNLQATGRNDLLQFSVMLSILFPLLTLLAKVRAFVELSTTYIANKDRRDSWLHTSLQALQQSLQKTSGSKKRKRRHQQPINIQNALSVFVGALMVVLGISFFVYIVVNILLVTEDCGKKLGKEIWEGAHPRYVFKDGPLITPTCHFETIASIKANGKGITHLTADISSLVNLIEIDLRDNEIKRLPPQITKLKRLFVVKFDRNPVWDEIMWENQGFLRYPKILFHFTNLRSLSLGYNRITNIPSSISRLGNLRSLFLQNNSIHRGGLSQEITVLTKLEVLNANFNPVASSLQWSNIDPTGALRILRLINNTMKDLDLSNGRFSAGETATVLQLLPRLERLNVSNNQLQMVSFRAVDFTSMLLQVLDVSLNPVKDVRLLDLYQLDNVHKRGMVYMKNLDAAMFAFDSLDVDRSRKLPFGLMGHYFAENVLLHVLFEGNGTLQFPFCRLQNNLISVTVKAVRNLSTACLGKQNGLKLLRLSENKIENINLNKFSTLELLELTKEGVKSIDVSMLASLQSLKLDDTPLSSIDLRNLSELTQLIFARNHFTFVNVSFLQKIKKLTIRDNPRLTNVYIGQLIHLTYLSLSGNQLKSIDLTQAVRLEELHLSRNQLTSINVKPLKQLKHVHLQENNLTSIINVTALTGLESLKLHSNSFNSSVPDTFSKLIHLSCLSMRSSHLKGNLPWIGELRNLELLDLRNNTLEGKLSLKQLLKLKYLGLGGSGIDMNTSEVQSMLPHLKYHGDHYRHESFTPEMSHSYNTWCI